MFKRKVKLSDSNDKAISAVEAPRRRSLRMYIGVIRQPKYMRVIAPLFLALLLMLGAVWYAYNYRTVLTVGSTSLTHRHYQRLLKQAEQDKIEPAAAKQAIVEGLKYKQAARQLNIKLSSNQLLSVAATRGIGGEILNEFQDLAVYREATIAEVSQAQRGVFAGAVLYFPFDAAFLNVEDTTKPKEFGTHKFIDDTRAYAKERAEYYHALAKDKKMNFDQIVKEILSDRRLKDAFGSNESSLLSVDESGTTFLSGNSVSVQQPPFVTAELAGLKSGGVSELKLLQGDYKESELVNVAYPADTAYYFVAVSKTTAPRGELSGQLDSKLKAIKVTDHVKLKK